MIHTQAFEKTFVKPKEIIPLIFMILEKVNLPIDWFSLQLKAKLNFFYVTQILSNISITEDFDNLIDLRQPSALHRIILHGNLTLKIASTKASWFKPFKSSSIITQFIKNQSSLHPTIKDTT